MNVALDLEGRVIHLRVRKGKVFQTKEHKPGAYLDVDREGRLLGVELLHPVSTEGIKDVADTCLERASRAMEAALAPV